MPKKNIVWIVVLWLLFFVAWTEFSRWKWGGPQQRDAAQQKAGEGKQAEGPAPRPASRADTLKAAAGVWASPPEKPAPRARPVAVVPPTDPERLIRLGRPPDPDRPNPFHVEAALDPRGAGVRSIVLNKFQAASPEGRAEWLDEARKTPQPLELLADQANRETSSFLVYLYDPRDPAEEHPPDALGRAEWEVIGGPDHAVKQDEAGGRRRQSVSFRTEVEDLRITKTFTLTEGDYHLGLQVQLERKAGGADAARDYRYQLTTGHGLPIEGEWYTGTFRNALIAQEGKGVVRDLQDLRQIAHKEGGDAVLKESGAVFCYAGVAVQYFASVVALDKEEREKGYIQRARPTLEVAVASGQVKSVAEDRSSFVLTLAPGREETFHVPAGGGAVGASPLLRPGERVAVTYRFDGTRADGRFRAVATAVAREGTVQPLFVDDITVRMVTEPIPLKPGETKVHQYVLYNGPVKAMLLGQMTGDRAVPEQVVSWYVDGLHLNTLTDYHSPGVFGRFASAIYWTDLIIKCTNLMHNGLHALHGVIPNYGLCIIVLTILVRAAMFPISRKQAMTTMRMQELAPELRKLQEKYKDDRQALGTAQMELYRRHGVNPFGTCWFLLLQMPIFMGLYFCLQESIFFRLAPFWPTWIQNLAAPDMLVHWGEGIPWVSRPQDYGSFFYLGPYFNLLPIVAVGLMIVQQKMMTPPPTDEQQRMQQSMMKYFTAFMGLLFYKVAAGLCVYFIASSLWGFAERKLLPKKKPAGGSGAGDSDAPPPGLLQKVLRRPEPEAPSGATGVTTAAARTGVTAQAPATEPRGRGKRKKDRRRAGRPEGQGYGPVPGNGTGAAEGWWGRKLARLREWWEDVLRQAKKK
jgi:YidC/Oxa1 family membrane protein insertase